ncbi:MAG: hypothetical protein IK142_03745 [Clostridiales bacterium]|nr:hypothetical protein [Clostridiales bacterium]
MKVFFFVSIFLMLLLKFIQSIVHLVGIGFLVNINHELRDGKRDNEH